MAAQATCGSSTLATASSSTTASSPGPSELPSSTSSSDSSAMASSIFSASARPWSPSTPWQLQVDTSPEALSSALEECLKAHSCYETPSGLTRRREVLSSLNLLVRQWIQSISLARGLAWQDLPRMGGRIVTYGSYKLGILHQGADIDALCLAPQHISRQEYFSSFFALLSYQKEVTELRAIEEAFVPVIKMRYDGIEVDMTFARLNIPELSNDDSDDFLSNVTMSTLDSKCLRSLNGYRATEELLRLVPNVEQFRLTLRAVKLWAKSKGLYSNTLGFLGGFSWAVLVAKACVSHPEVASVAQMLLHFFEMFAKWKWPAPVTLTSLDSNGAAQQQSFAPHMQSWNPERNLSERHHVMPVITPTFPHLNSTFNVSLSTQKLVQGKMAKAVSLCQEILEGKDTWNSLFQTSHIFHEYDSFLIVMASAVNHVQWFGLIESKLRYFVNNVEKDYCSIIHSARIWPKPFVQKGESKTSVTKQLWFVGLEFYNHIASPTVDTLRSLQNFRDNLTSHARGFYSPDMLVDAHYVHKSELTTRLSEREIEEIVANQSAAPSSTRSPPAASGRDGAADNSTDTRSRSPMSPAAEAPHLPAEQTAATADADDGSGRGGLSSPSYADAVAKSNSSSTGQRQSGRGGNGNGNGNGKRPPVNVAHLTLPAASASPGAPYAPPPSMRLMAKYPPPSSPMHPRASLTPPPHNMRYVMPPHSHYAASPCHVSNSSSSLQDFLGSPTGHGHMASGRASQSASFYANSHHINHHYHFYPRTNMSMYHHPVQDAVMQRTWPRNNAGHKKSHHYAAAGSHVHAYSLPPPPMNNKAHHATASADCCSTSSTSSSLGGNDLAEGASFEVANGDSGALNSSFGSADSDQGCARSVSFSSDKFPPPELTEARLRHAVDKVPFSPLLSPPPSTPPVFSAPYDASVPPPNVLPASASASCAAHTAGSQRYSASELRDMATPKPVQRYPHQPIHFRFTKSAISHHMQSMASDSAHDAVISH